MPRPERPLNGDLDDPVVDFAAGLRRLREEAGNPSYRVLAGTANCSAASLAAAASGRGLPTLAVTRAYVRACGGDVEEWVARWRALAPSRPPVPVAANAAVDPPYPGLAPFQKEDAEHFFGRRALLDDLVRRVSQRRLVVVFGPSGVGKSSVVRAGLLPAHEGPAILLVPDADPLIELSVRLAALARVPAGALLDDLRREPAHAGLVVRQALCDEPEGTRLLLVVDQFEGVFAAGVDSAAFIAVLVALCRADGDRTRVVLAVRADHYPRFVDHPELLAEMQDGQLLVGGMSPAELRDAVVKPAERVGARVEGALVSAIVADVAGRPGALPLASHALLESWRRRRGTTITLAGYEAAGGVDGAVAATAETVYSAFDDEQRHDVRRLLLRLVDVDDLGGITGRRVPRSRVSYGHVLDRLVDARLLTTDQGSVELAHESLIRAWPRLSAWVDADRETLRAHRRLTESAAAWAELGYDRGALYRSRQLAETRVWAGSRTWREALSPLERRFVEESGRQEAAEDTRRRRVSRRRRSIAAALGLILVTGTGAGSGATTVRWRCDPGAVGLLAGRPGMLTASEDGYHGADVGMLRVRTPPQKYGTWEQFQVCRQPGRAETFVLRGYAARFRTVSARPRHAGDAVLRLTRSSMGPYEWLKAHPVGGDEVLLWSVGHSRYLQICRDGSPEQAGRLAAVASAADATRFRFVALP